MNDNEDKTFFGEVIFFGDKKSGKNTFGFIARDGHDDIFVHFSDIQSNGFKTLMAGQKVSFQIGTNHDGKPKAINVLPLESLLPSIK